MKRLLFALAFLCAFAFAAETGLPGAGNLASETEDRSILSFFIQPSISFLSFDSRDKFQAEVDTVYKRFRAEALTEALEQI